MLKKSVPRCAQLFVSLVIGTKPRAVTAKRKSLNTIKDLISRTMAMYVCYKSYTFLSRLLQNNSVSLRARTPAAIVSYFHLKFNSGIYIGL